MASLAVSREVSMPMSGPEMTGLGKSPSEPGTDALTLSPGGRQPPGCTCQDLVVFWARVSSFLWSQGTQNWKGGARHIWVQESFEAYRGSFVLRLCSQTASVLVPAQLLGSCVTLGMLFYLSRPQFSLLENENKSIYLAGLLGVRNKHPAKPQLIADPQQAVSTGSFL